MTDASGRVVVLKPGDALYLGNLGQHDYDHVVLTEGLRFLSEALGLTSVMVFEQDIDLAAAAPVVPASDAVVLRVFDRKAMAEHREELAAWLTANGIDPMTVADQWLSIEQAGDQRLIRYAAYRLTSDGRRLTDPRSQDYGWTVERVSPLVIDLNLSAGQTVTDRDENP